ncbi:MAG: RdgB/HAM1 family non-canonical purine NTP pyrophosphatase [Terriglobales bacterium]
MSLPFSKVPIWRWLALGAISFLALTPFFWRGIPSGHDFEFHLFSWMEVLGQWKQGIIYPRWAALAHWGYGEARFLFYPPASWALGAALGALLPWRLVPGAYSWIALTLAGASMYKLAREWLPEPDALFAAALFAVNPYHLVIVYWRSAFAELLAAALLPLLLLGLLRLSEPGLRPVLWLSAILAAAWLTNAPAAVMIHYSVAAMALPMAVLERSWRPLLRTALAIVLGAGLASFYLIPAAYEEKWINISEVLAPGVRPQDNFLFTNIADPEHNQFNRLISTVAAAEIGALALVIWFYRAWRRQERKPWILLACWGGMAALIMVSITSPLWQHLPKLRFVQLPWRWLLCLNVALAMLLTKSLRRWSLRTLASATLLAVVVIAGYRIQPPWWDSAGDIQEMHEAVSDGTGYEGTDEYVPAGADPYELNKDLSPVTDSSGTPKRTEVLQWGPVEKHLVVHTYAEELLALRLFNYPAWEVSLNGKRVETQTAAVTGQMEIPVPAGRNDIRLHFGRTRDRTIGGLVSLLSFGVLLATWIKTRVKSAVGGSRMTARRVLVATSNPGKLRDFAGAAEPCGILVAAVPHFSSLPPVVENGATFEANARKKAEAYSLAVPGEVVLADDSGLEIDALGGAPGIHSARYAACAPHAAESNTDDEANNARVLRELAGVSREKRTARFVCVLAVARDGRTLQTFAGTAEGVILDAPRGHNGFGYDPLFYFPQIGKTFAELTAVEKSHYSHRGAAFHKFLAWLSESGPVLS